MRGAHAVSIDLENPAPAIILNMVDQRGGVGALKNRHVKTVPATREMASGGSIINAGKRADDLDEITAGHNQAICQAEMRDPGVAKNNRAVEQCGQGF